MTVRRCADCRGRLTGHGKPVRCGSCAARKRYRDKHGRAPLVLIAKCAFCRRKFSDYASNRRKGAEQFCSTKCRAAAIGVLNSVRRGGDGVKRSKRQRDRRDYVKHAATRRGRQSRYYADNRAAILERHRLGVRALKQEVVAAYGGKCECCGETRIEFLTIDHRDGSGAKHRSQVGKGRGVYTDLKRRGFPQGPYRCLCFNCNISRGFYGYCPHHPGERVVVDRRQKGVTGRPRMVA